MQSRNIVPCVSSKFSGVVPYAAQTQYRQETPYITGVTRDSNGTALPGCFVDCFTTADDVRRFATLSDLVTGAYSFQIGPTTGPYYCVAYKPGLPEVGGVTVDSLLSTSAAFNSTLMTGCQLWAKADVLGATLNNGDLIASWTDSSGSGNTLTQSTTANKPMYQAGTVNGLPSAFFDTDTFRGMTSSAPSGQKPVTFFVVCRISASISVNRRIFFDSGSGDGINLQLVWDSVNNVYTVQLRLGGATIIATSSSTLLVDTWYVIDATYSSTGAYSMTVNGLSAITPGTNDVVPGAFNRSLGLAGSNSFTGYIPEALQFNTVLSAADLLIIRTYLGRKYAITVVGAP